MCEEGGCHDQVCIFGKTVLEAMWRTNWEMVRLREEGHLEMVAAIRVKKWEQWPSVGEAWMGWGGEKVTKERKNW